MPKKPPVEKHKLEYIQNIIRPDIIAFMQKVVNVIMNGITQMTKKMDILEGRIAQLERSVMGGRVPQPAQPMPAPTRQAPPARPAPPKAQPAAPPVARQAPPAAPQPAHAARSPPPSAQPVPAPAPARAPQPEHAGLPPGILKPVPQTPQEPEGAPPISSGGSLQQEMLNELKTLFGRK